MTRKGRVCKHCGTTYNPKWGVCPACQLPSDKWRNMRWSCSCKRGSHSVLIDSCPDDIKPPEPLTPEQIKASDESTNRIMKMVRDFKKQTKN